MKTVVALAVYLSVVMTAVAGTKVSLEEARKSFEHADANLNRAYKAVCVELNKAEVVKLRELQRDWLQYRDRKAESLLWFNGIHTDEPKDKAEYWQNKAVLTENRTEFLRVFSGAAVARGISGDYSDFFDGDLHLDETKNGIAFSFIVVRGPSAHSGEISGIATRKGDVAIYKERVGANEDRKPCQIVFTFIAGHLVRVEGKDTDFFHGMGVSFGGLYYKTK